MIPNKSKESMLILLTGVIFICILIVETLYVSFISNPLGSTWFSGIITSVPFVLILLYLGFYIDKNYVSKKKYQRRILYWFFGSL